MSETTVTVVAPTTPELSEGYYWVRFKDANAKPLIACCEQWAGERVFYTTGNDEYWNLCSLEVLGVLAFDGFERLTRLLRLIALDNGLTLRPLHCIWPVESPAMELAAAALDSEADCETFAAGSVEDVERLIELHPELRLLSDFLNRAFDGDLAERFYFTVEELECL